MLTIIGSILLSVITAVKYARKEVAALANKKVIIGVLSVDDIPDELAQYPDTKSYRQARLLQSHCVILICRNLSFALRYCDWVCVSTYAGADKKIILKDSSFWHKIAADEV